MVKNLDTDLITKMEKKMDTFSSWNRLYARSLQDEKLGKKLDIREFARLGKKLDIRNTARMEKKMDIRQPVLLDKKMDIRQPAKLVKKMDTGKTVQVGEKDGY